MQPHPHSTRRLIRIVFSLGIALFLLGALLWSTTGAGFAAGSLRPRGVDVSGAISQDTTWTLANSPYVLTGDVTVNAGVTLTIEPGVVVMGWSNVELQVLGHLEAVGSESAPITFTSVSDSRPGQWTGLVFDGGTGNLVHTTVRYGGDHSNSVLSYRQGSNIAMRNVLTGEVRIENSAIISQNNNLNYYGNYNGPEAADFGMYVENSRVVVSDTLFSGNGNYTSSDYALYATGTSTVTVYRARFIGNIGNGIHLADGSQVAALIVSSAFVNNGSNGIYNDTTSQIDLRSNWWGDVSGPGGTG
jgi:hypothetical protein